MAEHPQISQNLVVSPNYGKLSKWDKLKRKVKSIILKKIVDTPLQFKLYPAYWHYRFQGKGDRRAPVNLNRFLTQKPNYGAGIGHQLANWNSGLYYAGLFGLKYAHSPFSTKKWDEFLGFGQDEILADSLLNDPKFKVVRLPSFNSTRPEEIELVRNIIRSYTQNNILFLLEQDQGYKAQCGTSDLLKAKFFNARSRADDRLIFSEDTFNIAVHIRRRMKIETPEVWSTRGLGNEYFATVLRNTLKNIPSEKTVAIYLFSQGEVSEFPEFAEFENINYCVDMGPVESVLHMINADLLISSKSSFSYKPALISNGIQIAPKTFWHFYPETDQYIMADNNGNFEQQKLKSKFI
ncbi:hypothetical protein [Pedobacter duraquae]|uniref:Glycosyl transferase family 11 n=1 Tax=Pedobacter duraquae TaxID=425511 RepID=A0A4R6IDN6_9SPHI|nr:hypothetical protein [Pedobacter duraquae]TDO19015.1 hypothetical protein CLV32_4637 [Pedobacter duraquae]